MTPEIKQRIQQIRQGKTPKGYKKTKEGIIPNEWKIYNLGEITSKIGSGKTPLGGEKSYVDNGIPLVRSQNIINDIVNLNDVVYIEEEMDNSMDNSKVYYNDVLLNITGASIGRSAVYKYNKHANVNQHVCIIRVIDGYNSDYVKLNISSEYGQKLIEMCQTGSGREGLNFQEIAKMKFQFPPLPEQTAIAEILSTQDRVIELKEQLLAENKRQKKYLMQQLLTGKMRLKGFKGEWKRCRLGELGSLKNGMNFSKEAMNKGFPFVNLMNIFGKTIVDYNNLGLAEASEQQLKEYNLVKGDVLFVRSSVKLEGVGEAALVPIDLLNTTYSGFIIRFRDRSGLSNSFKQYIFSSDCIRKQIMSKATDSANKNINQSVLADLLIPIPPLPEQTAIAEILSTADREIELLGQSIEAEKQKKKSLMQLLLTGIVRVDGV